MLPKRLSSQRGFTMIEMLTVLVIISVLTAISAVIYSKASQRSRLARVKTNVGLIELGLDDYSRGKNGLYPALTVYHNNLPDSGSLNTTPPEPDDPIPGVPQVVKRMGNGIIGGGPALKDVINPLQDDFYRDELPSPPDTISYFRNRVGEKTYGNGPMRPVDQLVLNGQLDAYPLNPMKGPGVPMVNVAYILMDYDTQTNDFRWVDIDLTSISETRTGLCAARPAPTGVYEPIDVIWNEATYPQGDFAYIPFNFNNEQGLYCKGYWIIVYGDLTTLQTSDYNKYSIVPGTNNDVDATYHNWPNLPRPFGDGNPDTPPAVGSFEWQVKCMMYGALEVRSNIFQDQFSQLGQ